MKWDGTEKVTILWTKLILDETVYIPSLSIPSDFKQPNEWTQVSFNSVLFHSISSFYVNIHVPQLAYLKEEN